MNLTRRVVPVLATAFIVGSAVVSCGSERACAAELVISRGGSASGSGSRTGGASSGGKSSGGSPSKSSSGSPSGSPSGKSGASGQSRTAAQQKVAQATVAKPGAKIDSGTASAIRSAAPPAVTRGGSYTSAVTGNTYVYHSMSYYQRPGIYVDYGDPYNYYNYYYFRDSPYYGMPYRYAGTCGGPEREAPKPDVNNINITIDNDGKIVSATDKNQVDPDLTASVAADGQPSVDPAGTVAP